MCQFIIDNQTYFLEILRNGGNGGYNTDFTVNTELGNALRTLHPRWKENGVYTEKTGLILNNTARRIDIMFNHPTGIPVAIETEFSPARSVEADARYQLGRIFTLRG